MSRPIKIATFNINSVRRRIGNLLDWLQEAEPDIVLLQELKAQDEQFPRLDLEAKGYRAAVVGQKSYNGVAILARGQIDVTRQALPGDDQDTQARYVEGIVSTDAGRVRVASIYLPNGNPSTSDKFAYKLRFMERLRAHAQSFVLDDEPVVLGGDYNVCPTDDDVYDPAGWANDALCRPESRLAFRALLNLGYADAFRTLDKTPHAYTFWDYQAGAWQRGNGLRIDHLLLNPAATDRLVACEIDKAPRGRPEPSDHTPIWCSLELAT